MEARSVLSIQPPNEQACIANEKSQCRVRVFVVLFLSGLFFRSGYTTHPLFIFLVVYTIALLAISTKSTSYSPARYSAAIVLDATCSIGGLLIIGVDAAILFVVLVQVAFGAGVRYGLPFLNFAVLFVESSLVGLLAISPYWQVHREWIFVFFIAIPFIGYYVKILLENLRVGKLRAEQRERSMIESLVCVGHEVRTPLQAMLVICDLIEGEFSGKEQLVRLNRLRSAIDGLARLGKDMIDVARIYAEVEGNYGVSDIQAAVVKSAITFSDSATRKGLEFSIELPLDNPTEFRFDKLRLEQLLRNLLSNAIRCTDAGSLRVRSAIHKVREGRWQCSIEVTDTGTGIPEKKIAEIFSEASQPKRTEGSAYYGTGLGLAISRELAAGLGGELKVRSTVGVGSAFEVIFPLHISEPKEAQCANPIALIFFGYARRFMGSLNIGGNVRIAEIVNPAEYCECDVAESCVLVIDERDACTWVNQRRKEQSKPHCALVFREEANECLKADFDAPAIICFSVSCAASSDVLNSALISIRRYVDEEMSIAGQPLKIGALLGKTVLVANDNRMNRELAMLYLSNAGALVRTAVDGVEVVQLAASRKFDAMLLDWNMPAMNGKEVLEYLHRCGQNSHTAIVVLTAEESKSIESIASALGAVYVLEQPVSAGKIVNTLSLAIGTKEEEISSELVPESEIVNSSFDFRQYIDLLREGVPEAEVRRLLGIFLNETSALMLAFSQAANSSDTESSRKVVHAISGMAYAAGANYLAETTSDFLRNADVNEVDWALAQIEIRSVWDVTAVAIRQWLARNDRFESKLGSEHIYF